MPRRNKAIRIYKAAYFGVIIARLEVIQAGFRIVVVTTVAEGVLGAYRVCSCVIYRKNFALCVVGVGYDELAGGCISQCHHITLNIVQVIVEIITSVGHTDTVALLVVEEAQGLAVGRLGEYLRAVEQILGRGRAYGFARADAFGVIGEGKFFILFSLYKLPALPCPTHRK